MRRSLLLPVIAALLVLTLAASSAPAQYRFDSWTTDNGLPQNVVYAVTQTRDGYLWLTTFDGLVRYDGVRFTVFDKSNTRGLVSNRFSALLEDTDGTLWIGTIDAGLTRLRNGVFTSFTTADGLPHNQIHSLQREPNGDLLIITHRGIAYWRGGRLVADPGQFDPISVKRYVSPNGARWQWDEQGLHRLQNGQTVTFPIQLKAKGSTAEMNMFADRQGKLWVGTYGDGVYCITGDVVTHFTTREGLPDGMLILPHCQDHADSVWFGAEDPYGNRPAGLISFKNGRFVNYTTALGLSNSAVKTIFEDREGTIWIGTNGRGLNRLTRQFITSYSTAEGLVSNNVYPIYEDRAGDIWIGAFGGLSRFKNGVFTNYTIKEGLLSPNVQALFEDSAGRLWMGGRPSYFQDGKFHLPLEGIPLNDYVCYSIHEDRAGVLWFGTQRGLIKYDQGRTTFLSEADGVPSGDIAAIHEDRQGLLWFGTGAGLARLENGKFITLTVRDGLVSNAVRCIYEDADGVLWIGTYDGGLSRYQNGRFTNYTTREGLYNNGVFQILEDGRGYFWISSNRGIYRVSKQQLNDFAAGKVKAVNSISYNKQDGLLNIECNGGRQPGGIKARDGKLWFPTQQGVAVINPDEVPTNPLAPPVLIESCLLDREAVPFSNELRVNPGQSNLEINYTGLSFIKPEQVRFKYQLVGQDREWIDAGTRRSANYSYLPAGQYTFRVIAANSDGVWNDTGATIKIVVVPRFYRTWWFLSLVVLLIVGLAISVYRWRVWQLQRRNALQENFSRQLIQSQEGERKRIAAELHDSIGQSLLIIKNRAFLGLNGGDGPTAAREQLQEISGSVTDALEEVRAIAYDLRPSQLERLGLSTTLEEMLERVAATSEIDFTYQIAPLEGAFTPEMEINFYRVVQESINNIIKHSQATEAKVNIRRTPQTVELTIEDNGRGFVAESTSVAAAGKRSFGLTGMAERVRMLGGSLHIDSTQGTSIRINLAIGTRAL